ncbi:hypothetical protein [Bradyrhizobium sp. 930_D9_N1_4]|uniref:hypothetical protein n=1 Tax=Bradyrhizobium sp. 930_D9_N1_4 TaxID=3240374 RepID=UPI003F89ECDD
MLPGFRFLFAAILLSASILVFGLGAASLLRATHQQYANNPSWRNGPQEQVFAQESKRATEPAQPVLAVLRAEPEPAIEPSLRDQVPTIGLPATGPEQVAALTTGSDAQSEPPVAVVVPPAETAPLAADAPVKSEAASLAPADTLTPADATASTVTKTPPPAATAVDVPRTATSAPASRVDIAAARMAALNELTPAKPKADSATPDSKPRARKPKKRHRVVRRPPPQQLNQALDPFGQPQQTLATATTRAR